MWPLIKYSLSFCNHRNWKRIYSEIVAQKSHHHKCIFKNGAIDDTVFVQKISVLEHTNLSTRLCPVSYFSIRKGKINTGRNEFCNSSNCKRRIEESHEYGFFLMTSESPFTNSKFVWREIGNVQLEDKVEVCMGLIFQAQAGPKEKLKFLSKPGPA